MIAWFLIVAVIRDGLEGRWAGYKGDIVTHRPGSNLLSNSN